MELKLHRWCIVVIATTTTTVSGIVSHETSFLRENQNEQVQLPLIKVYTFPKQCQLYWF